MAGGTLAVPNTFATQTGNVPASQLDDNNNTIETYVNNREVAVGLLAARPAAGTRGQWFHATDVGGGTLYADNGVAWVQMAPAVFPTAGGWQTLSQSATSSTVTGVVVETSLKSFTLAAGQMASADDVVRITALFQGSSDAFTKRLRLKFGGTTIADSGAVFNLTQTNVGRLTADVIRRTGTTQLALSTAETSAQAQTWVNAVGGGSYVATPAETLSGTVLIDFTVEPSNAAASMTCHELQVAYFRVP